MARETQPSLRRRIDDASAYVGNIVISGVLKDTKPTSRGGGSAKLASREKGAPSSVSEFWRVVRDLKGNETCCSPDPSASEGEPGPFQLGISSDGWA